jgi:hypothetical protein
VRKARREINHRHTQTFFCPRDPLGQKNVKLSETSASSVGAVADPTKSFVSNVVVGRATVPASGESISGYGHVRDLPMGRLRRNVWVRPQTCGRSLHPSAKGQSASENWGWLLLAAY